MQGMIALEIGILAVGWLRYVRKKDPECQLRMDKRVYSYIIIYCITGGFWIECFLKYRAWYGQMACGVLAAYLLVAAIQDMQCCEVYDILHILAVPSGLLLLKETDGRQLLSLLMFIILQFVLFMRLYGEADGYAFLVCAIYESNGNGGFITYLLHMASAFMLLAVVQGIKHNIAGNGNLRKPVPFLPYIATTVWPFL